MIQMRIRLKTKRIRLIRKRIRLIRGGDSQFHSFTVYFRTLPHQTCVGNVNIFKYIYNYINIIRKIQRVPLKKLTVKL